jgi:hypothetical protein
MPSNEFKNTFRLLEKLERPFTLENTLGFNQDELDEMNRELIRVIRSDKLKHLEKSDRYKILSEKIVDKFSEAV